MSNVQSLLQKARDLLAPQKLRSLARSLFTKLGEITGRGFLAGQQAVENMPDLQANMRLLPKKIHHLIRYFLIGGIIAFVLYWITGGARFTLLFMGPPIYLVFWMKHTLSGLTGPLPSGHFINDFIFLLPTTLIYFGAFGFQIKQLWNERGVIRTISLVALIGFLLYVHFKSLSTLSAYFVPNA